MNKCSLGIHTWKVFSYDGYCKIMYCIYCEKTKTKYLK
jgi:hypothetical protein